MHYHLLHRFSGALVGSLLAELLAMGSEKNLTQIERHISLASQTQIAAIDLIMAQKNFSASGIAEKSIIEWLSSANISQAAVAILPLMLLWHEDNNWLQTELAEIDELNQIELGWWNLLVCRCLKETDFPPYLSQSLTTASIQTLLQKIEDLIQQGKSYSTVINCLAKLPINQEMALAYYCFACTPTDFGLAVRRAIVCSGGNPTVAALTGALAGINNTGSGIPIGWKQQFREVKLLLELEAKAKILFGLWSGMNQPETEFDWEQSIITTAGLVQSRHQLKIISQL